MQGQVTKGVDVAADHSSLVARIQGRKRVLEQCSTLRADPAFVQHAQSKETTVYDILTHFQSLRFDNEDADMDERTMTVCGQDKASESHNQNSHSGLKSQEAPTNIPKNVLINRSGNWKRQ